jgi:hypothetical protein
VIKLAKARTPAGSRSGIPTESSICIPTESLSFETREYEEYILGQFSATPDILIINFDKAIRSRVGRANNLKLSSIEMFSDLYTSQVLLATRGSYSSSKVSGLRTQSRVRDEVCLRWNKDGKCDFIGCRFKHVCATCKSNGHTTSNCPRSSTRK